MLGDATQLHQVLLNLCVNARAAMPGGGQLHLAAVNGELAGPSGAQPTVEISVRDTGTGMPPQVLEQIFDPFYTTKAQGQGTGLGLSTSLAIVRQHGGEMLVRSEPGVGTRFTLRLPAITHEGPRTVPADLRDLLRGREELLLVVDDEAAVRRVMQQTLETFGYRVLCAVDGRDGLRVFTEHRQEIAAVLTDLMMPTMDGITLIRQLREIAPDVRILAFSGLETAAAVSKPAGRASIDVLPKPFSSPVLLEAVRALLDGVPRRQPIGTPTAVTAAGAERHTGGGSEEPPPARRPWEDETGMPLSTSRPCRPPARQPRACLPSSRR